MLLFKARDQFVIYLKTKKRAEATLIAYSKDILQLVEYLDKNGVKDSKNLKKADLEDFLKYLAENGYTKKTISRKINAIKTFCKYVLEQNEMKEDPASSIMHPKLGQNAPRILTRIEYRALRDTVKDDVRTKAIVEILLQTGIKIHELANMKITDITFTAENQPGVLHVRASSSSGPREIPLNMAVQDAIREYLKERPQSELENLFVTKTGKSLLIRNIRATLDRYFKQINLNDITVNDLRHTFIAEHLVRGASVLLVSKIAGHKRLSTTENYLKYIDRKESGLGVLEEL